MGNFPFGRAKSTNPETFHVHNCSRVDDEPAVVTLGDGTQLVPEKDRRRLLHCPPDRKSWIAIKKDGDGTKENLDDTYGRNRFLG